MKVSIIIPAYNTGELLKIGVESILNQPFQDWELIIVDDGSKDNTGEIADNVAKTDSRIKVIHTENNGVYIARLTGVEKAAGDWIMFMDSDDTITAECLPGLSSHISDKFDIIVGNININNKYLFDFKRYGNLTTSEYTIGLLDGSVTHGLVSKLYRRSLFDNLPQPTKRVIVNEDMLLLLSLTRNAKGVFIDPKLNCYNYIFRDNSGRTATMSFEQWQALFDAIQSIIIKYNNPDINEAFVKMILHRIKIVMIAKGQYVDTTPDFVKTVIEYSKNHNLTKEELQTLRLINSKLLQFLYYNKLRLIRNIKSLIKKALKIK